MADPTDLTTYPIPSSSFVPAQRNAQDLDSVVNGGAGETVTNRAGNALPTISKVIADASIALDLINVVGDYAAATEYNKYDVVRDAAGDDTWYVTISDSYTSVSIASDVAAGNLKVYQYGSIGTAAQADITTSSTDATAGRVLKVGDFGYTGTSVKPLCLDVDDKTLVRGKYYISNPLGILPVGFNGFGFFDVDTVANPDAIVHTLTQAGQSGTQFRKWERLWHNLSATPSTWREILHTGNTGSISTDLSATDTTAFNHTTTGSVQAMYSAGVQVGSISVTGAATSFNTSSDYRLKQDILPIENASDSLMSLNPINYKWKSTGTRTIGFLAHELQEVLPDAVTGEKDQVETIESTDEDGNITTEERPIYQSVDQSKVVPLLVAALQEALSRIDALETKQ